MSEHRATVSWTHRGGDFKRGTYSRVHRWRFDGGASVEASAAPSHVPLPYSNPELVDPEEGYVASIASCHLLTFIFLAHRGGFEVLSYTDEAVGRMTENDRGGLWISEVTLHPQVTYAEAAAPSLDEERALHQAAHEQCYVANSVRTAIRVIPSDRQLR